MQTEKDRKERSQFVNIGEHASPSRFPQDKLRNVLRTLWQSSGIRHRTGVLGSFNLTGCLCGREVNRQESVNPSLVTLDQEKSL